MNGENMEFIFLIIILDCGPKGYTYPCLKVIDLNKVCLGKNISLDLQPRG